MAGLLSVGSSALLAAYTQLQTSGHNIANANTPGYSRQEVMLASGGADFTGAGFIGRGVDVADVRRRYDGFVSRAVQANGAMAAADTARATQVGRLDQLFAESSAGIGAAYDDMQLALSDVVNRPADPSPRAVFLARAQTLSDRVGGFQASIEDFGVAIEGRIEQGVTAVNGALQRLARLNGEISTSAGSTIQPNDLLDERDRLVETINGTLRATAYIAADGSANVFASGGQALVTSTRAASLALRQDPLDASKSQLLLRTDGSTIPLDAATLGGGSLQGLLMARDQDLASARVRIGQLSAGMAQAYNGQQALGVDRDGAPGRPLFSIGTPVASPATTNGGSGAITATVQDATALTASDLRVTWTGSAYDVVRLPDGSSAGTFATLPAAPGASIDGLSVTVTGTPAAGDTFLVKSGSVLATGFARRPLSSDQIASAYPLAPTAGAANTGSVRVSGFSMVAPAGSPLPGPVTLAFTSAGTFDVSGLPGGPLTGLSYVSGQPLPDLPGTAWRLTLSGTPAAGDSLVIGPNADPATDNRNARAMAQLSTAAAVGGATISDAYGALVADVGTRAQSAQSSQAMSEKLLENAKSTRAQVSGVNLDEEAARLLQFQQAYQAAAKVIQAAQSMFDTLLQSTR